MMMLGLSSFSHSIICHCRDYTLEYKLEYIFLKRNKSKILVISTVVVIAIKQQQHKYSLATI
jgi:hypothetical protein